MHRKGALMTARLRRLAGAGRGGAAQGRRGDHALEPRPRVPAGVSRRPPHEDRILVQTGEGHSIVSCGGVSSWQDLSLLPIAKYGSIEEAVRISRLFLYQRHREGQLPYASMAANVDHGDGAILKCQAWLAEDYARADIVAEAVRLSGLPKRTFDRRFKAATGSNT